MVGKSEGRDRLLLRLPNCLKRPDAQQRYERRAGRVGGDQGSVRAIRLGVPGFAPLYRQVTLTALRARIAGKPMTVNCPLGYNDVADAWKYYLEHDNRAAASCWWALARLDVLTQMIRNEIDGKAVQERLISALLLGTSLPVPKGKDVGGAFKQVPLCRSASRRAVLLLTPLFAPTCRRLRTAGSGAWRAWWLRALIRPARGRRRRVARLFGGSPTRSQFIGTSALGDARTADQHAFCQRAGTAYCRMCLERERLLPPGYGAWRPGRRSHR